MHANEKNSTMKTYLDKWYDSNLKGMDSKLSKDTIFCNNRQVSTYKSSPYVGDGYGVTPTMYSYPRFYNWSGSSISPSLTCPGANDKFTVTTTKGNGELSKPVGFTTTKGNGELSKPVGLITADEVSMAGGRTSSQNTLYYLYTGTTYWTMTPSGFGYLSVAYEFNVFRTGTLSYVDVNSVYGVRPVVNLNTENLTFTGTGTMQDPYVIS